MLSKSSRTQLREKVKRLTQRTQKTKSHIKVINERCTGCGLCVKFCPSGSWEMENVAAWKYGMEFCLECGTCFNLCVVKAIDWSYPLGGEGIISQLG